MANPDQCAVNPDGTLKDASEIIFYDSEGNDQPIPMHSVINPTSSQDQTSRAARGANSQQDNLVASSAVPARKVAGTRQHKLAWKLTTDENAASTSTGGQKRKHPEQAPTTAKQPKAANSTARHHSNAITLSDDEDDTQAQRDTSVLSWNKATAHHGSGNNNGEDEDSDGEEAEGDYEDIQAERVLDTKVRLTYLFCRRFTDFLFNLLLPPSSWHDGSPTTTYDDRGPIPLASPTFMITNRHPMTTNRQQRWLPYPSHQLASPLPYLSHQLASPTLPAQPPNGVAQ
ncbi:hypothetical protein BDN67DRAFT_1017666 [Paxillus ammoniavirescens]|nr:hypothetical protein BDN67DRAFT_1017666 [Paxillus ammoniavirescens]